MMKNLNKDFEMLSAYIDGELSAEEIKVIEEKISLSKELQDKLAELKKIKKLTVSSISNIESDSFFETRLMANLNSEKSFKSRLRKWFPSIGFAILAVALMLFLKFNPTIINDVLKDQENNISNFYAANLQPLLSAAGFTEEDIFNFAFSNELPLDSEKQKFLQLSSDKNGNSFEIKTSSISSKNTFEKFIKVMDLNEKQKLQMDSILDSYKDDLQKQVLVNNNNTIAINPNIWNYHKAIFIDIMKFAKNVNKKRFNDIAPVDYAYYSGPAAEKVMNQIKSDSGNEYIFITPDSVFKTRIEFDKNKFKTDYEEMQKDLSENLEELNENLKEIQVKVNLDSNLAKLQKKIHKNQSIKIYTDSDNFKIEIPPIPDIPMSDFEDISSDIEEALKHIHSFSFSIPEFDGKNSFNFKFKDGDSSHSFNFTIPNVDSLIQYNSFDDTVLINGKKFHIWGDSSKAVFRMFKNDSTIIWNQEEFKEQMREMQKEMQKFREEMKKFHQDFKNEEDENEIKEINSNENMINSVEI